MSLVSCNRRFDRLRNQAQTVEQISSEQKDEAEDEVQVVQNEFNVDIFSGDVALIVRRKKERRVEPICRGMDGCLHVCEYFQHSDCKQLVVKDVVKFWLNRIKTYSGWNQAQKDLNLIAVEPSVAEFLKNVDTDNQVVWNLFHLSSSARCNIRGGLPIFFSYSPSASLYVGPKNIVAESTAVVDDTAVDDTVAVAETAVQRNKKIIDGARVSFNLNVFSGWIKKCFGYNTRTFAQLALEIENQDAFEIGGKALLKACGGNAECVRLAYCSMEPQVWEQVGENIKTSTCTYDSFTEML